MGRYNLKYGTIGATIERDPGEPPCYTDEWKRSNPDYVVYLPQEFIGHDTDNVHFLVVATTKGNLIGTWCQGTYEASDNSCVVMARSEDGGTDLERALRDRRAQRGPAQVRLLRLSHRQRLRAHLHLLHQAPGALRHGAATPTA